MSSKVTTNMLSGSIFGGVLLITGSCVGAGMLALPVITGLGGFIPSTLLFLAAWAFMAVTAMLLLEVNIALGHHLSLISIAEKTLGKTGKFFAWILFLFLFYALGIAYIAASGDILRGILENSFGILLPSWLGSFIFTAFFGCIIYLGTRPVDYLNRLLMVGLVLTYVILVTLGLKHIQPAYLLSHNWSYAFSALPILVISFGFHNMIPSLADYFQGDLKRLRITIFLGSLIPLLIYLLWEAMMLGIIPLGGRDGLLEALNQGQAATAALHKAVGNSWIGPCAECFALFAIITSFLAQSLSLVDFLSDGLKIPKVKLGRVALIALTLIPPFLFAFFNPGIFISALNAAGGYSAVILFGVMPVLMTCVIRKKIPLYCIFVLLFACTVFFLELFKGVLWVD